MTDSDKIEILEQKLEIAINALKFYSGIYEPGLSNPNDGPWGVNSVDFGYIAQNAITEIDKMDYHDNWEDCIY